MAKKVKVKGKKEKVLGPLGKVPKFKTADMAAKWIAAQVKAGRWEKGGLAFAHEDTEGGNFYKEEVDVTDPMAASFCAIGFVTKADQGFEDEIGEELCLLLSGGEPLNDPSDWAGAGIIDGWNDSPKRKASEVAKAFQLVAKRIQIRREYEKKLAQIKL